MSYNWTKSAILVDGALHKNAVATCQLDETHTMIFANDDSADDSNAYVLTYNIATNSVSKGPTIGFTANDATYIVAKPLDVDKVLIAYRDSNNGNYTTLQIFTVDFATNYALPSSPVVITNNTTAIDLEIISPTKAVLLSRETIRILEINGTTITQGTPVNFPVSGTIQKNAVALLNENEGVLASNSNVKQITAFSISGNSITIGDSVAFPGNAFSDYRMCAINKTDVVISEVDNINSDLYLNHLTISNGTITSNYRELHDGNFVKTLSFSIMKAGENEAIITYFGGSSDIHYSKLISFTSVGSTVTATIDSFTGGNGSYQNYTSKSKSVASFSVGYIDGSRDLRLWHYYSATVFTGGGRVKQIWIGQDQLTKILDGGTEIVKVYIGDQLIYEV